MQDNKPRVFTSVNKVDCPKYKRCVDRIVGGKHMVRKYVKMYACPLSNEGRKYVALWVCFYKHLM